MTFTDLKNKVYFLTKTNSTSFPDPYMTNELNNGLDRVVSLIFQSDSRWTWDDENNTDLPIATTALVSGQQDYALSVSHLEIVRAEVQDTSGDWIKLRPIDSADIYDESVESFPSIASNSTSGVPMYYQKLGNSLMMYPTPNYSQSASLKLFFKRGPSYFATNDTTKTPGFNALYHDLVALWASYNFALANGRSNAQLLYQEIQAREDALLADYSLRARDDTPQMKARPINWR